MAKIDKVPEQRKARSLDPEHTRRMSRDDPAVLAFVYLTYASAMVVKLADEQLRASNLSVARYTILRLLEDGEPRTLGYLSEKHFCVPGNITKLVSRMQQDGLIDKKTDETDRRVSLVTITAKGRALCDSASPDHRRFIQSLTAPLSGQDLETLRGYLETIAARAVTMAAGTDPGT